MATILVVDDHPINRQLVVAILRPQGHTLLEAGDGVEALEITQKTPPDLIILDVVMPRMSGIGFLDARRRSPRLLNVPVILYTAIYRLEEAQQLSHQPGVVAVLTKPAEPQLLASLVSSTVGAAVEPVSLSSNIAALQSANAQLTAIVELVGDLTAERDANRMIKMFCNAVRAIIPSARAMIIFKDGKSNVCGNGDSDDGVPAILSTLLRSDYQQAVRRFGPGSVHLRPLHDVRSALIVPIAAPGSFIGSLVLLNRESRDEFSLDDEGTATTLAARFALVYDNFAQHRDLQERFQDRAEELQQSRQELAVVFDDALAAIVELDSARNVRAWNRTAETMLGWRQSEVIGRPYPAVPVGREIEFEEWSSRCLTGEVLQAMPTQRLRRDGAVFDALVSMVPIKAANGHVRGVMHVVVDETAQRAAGYDLVESRQEIRELARQRHDLRVEKEERTRIARELHDQLGQLLTAIKLDVSRLAPGVQTADGIIRARLLEMIDETIDVTTNVVHALRPTAVDQLGLPAAIEKEISEFQERTGIECDLSIRPADFDLEPAAADAFYRVFEEAMTNVARHSGASHVDVRLRKNPSEVILEIRDNGRGIKEAQIRSLHSFGLMSMRERLHVLGGWVRIEDVEGDGTVVTAMLRRSRS